MTLTDTYTLSNGVKIPVVGFGTWQSEDGDEAYNAVKAALQAGYRHIDTAAVYGNEISVGKAIEDFLADTPSVKREDLFITTKLWNDVTTFEGAKVAINVSLSKLRLDYVDLFLIHWPNPKDNRPNNKERNAEIYRALEFAVEKGKAKAIGVSNFHPHHLDDLLETAKIKPVVNQIMVNPSDQQPEIVSYNKAHDILTEAYSPLGTGKIFGIKALDTLASKYGKTVAQVVLRWSLDKGYLPLPKSVTPERIKENADIFDFTLDAADIAVIDGLTGEAGSASNPDEVGF